MKFVTRFALLPIAIGATLAVGAFAGQKVRLTLGGRALVLDAVQVKGKTYVSLDQLKAQMATKTGGGMSKAPGGANELAATEGVMNDWLFNGVWRFRVKSVEWNATEAQWWVNVELRNGTGAARKPGLSGMDGSPANTFFLATESGNTLSLGVFATNETQTTITYKELPPGAGAMATLRFAGKPDERPAKLICVFKPYGGLPYAKDPSFRVDLTRSKS